MGSPAAGTFGDLRLVVGREPFDDLRAKKRPENEEKNELKKFESGQVALNQASLYVLP